MFWSYAPVYLSWGDIHVLELCSCLLMFYELGGHPCSMSYAPVYLSWGDIHVLELCSCLLKLGGHPCSGVMLLFT